MKLTRGPAEGQSVEAVKRLSEKFKTDAQWLSASDGAQDDAFGAAALYWLHYPLCLELMGHNWDDGNGPRWHAYHDLNHVHYEATRALMRVAERLGIDSGPLWESAQLCRHLFSERPWRYENGPYETWPDCLGSALDDLPPDAREVIRRGDAVFQRLGARIDIAAACDTLRAALTGNKPARRPRRKGAPREVASLTARQLEAVKVVGECEGNFSKAARRMGVDPKTCRQHHDAAMRKLGKAAVPAKMKTQKLPTDRRGAIDVAASDDCRQ